MTDTKTGEGLPITSVSKIIYHSNYYKTIKEVTLQKQKMFLKLSVAHAENPKSTILRTSSTQNISHHYGYYIE